MSTLTRPTDTAGPSTSRYWLAAVIAIVGLVAGVAFGVVSYTDSQDRIDDFDRVSIPGRMAVQLDEATGRVMYYEGSNTIRFNELSIAVTDPAGTPVDVSPYEGEMIYETGDLTQGRAVATFDASEPGTYEIAVSGIDSGQLVVGESFSGRALPGVLAALAIAGLSVIAGSVLWLRTLIKRSQRTINERDATPMPAAMRRSAGP
jgi:hypothetical protein